MSLELELELHSSSYAFIFFALTQIRRADERVPTAEWISLVGHLSQLEPSNRYLVACVSTKSERSQMKRKDNPLYRIYLTLFWFCS